MPLDEVSVRHLLIFEVLSHRKVPLRPPQPVKCLLYSTRSPRPSDQIFGLLVFGEGQMPKELKELFLHLVSPMFQHLFHDEGQSQDMKLK